MLSTNRLGQQKCNPCVKKCVENATPPSESQLHHPPTSPCTLSYSRPLPPHSTFLLPSLVALEVDGNPPTLGRSVRTTMGERFTSPLPLSAWGSDPTCRKMHEKTHMIEQTRRFTPTLPGVLERLISIPMLDFLLRVSHFGRTFCRRCRMIGIPFPASG